MAHHPPRILIIAGSDSGGGAGLQADIKTITMLGGYAMTAVTAITVQNTCGVSHVMPVSTDMIRDQIMAVVEDIGVDDIKIGMLGSQDSIECVASALTSLTPRVPIILDPVMQAKGGASLLEEGAAEAMVERLFSMASLITPNLPEAEHLTGNKIRTTKDMEQAGQKLLDTGAEAVLIKGGHGTGKELVNVLCTHEGVHQFRSTRIDTPHTHGTGCTLASAIATYLAKGQSLKQAVQQAQDYVHGAILHAPGYGKGHGPLHHGWVLDETHE